MRYSRKGGHFELQGRLTKLLLKRDTGPASRRVVLAPEFALVHAERPPRNPAPAAAVFTPREIGTQIGTHGPAAEKRPARSRCALRGMR
jgi:hypothetical protein